MEIFGIAETAVYRKVTVSFPFVEQTLVKIVQIVCSQRYGEIGYVLSDNLGEFANQPNVNICLQIKPGLPHFLICLQGQPMQILKPISKPHRSAEIGGR